MSEKVMFLDTGKLTVDGSAISGYSKVNDGEAIQIYADSATMVLAMGQSNQPSVGKDTNNDGYMEENETQTTGVANRAFTITGLLDMSKSAHRTQFKHFLLMRRSVAVFAFKHDYFTVYDEDPVNSSYNNLSSQDSNFTANSFVYVKIGSITFTSNANTRTKAGSTEHVGHILEYTIEAVYTQN